MPLSLLDLRLTPQISPARFVAWQAGCHIQYYDDTQARDSAKALSSRVFDTNVARYKQQQGCAVSFSLQAFGKSRTKNELLCFRNLGVDVDLISTNERHALSANQIDARKQDYLTGYLAVFPLAPHWLIETRHGFHVIFRIKPLRQETLIHEAMALNRQLVRVLRGDDNAVLLTQVFRVPGTLHLKREPPFVCRLLLDNSARIPPYDLGEVRAALAGREQDGQKEMNPPPGTPTTGERPAAAWRKGLGGVPVGQRNATAASLVGAILAGLPEELWEIAGWGGLREWNAGLALPMAERELRTVFRSIVRREHATRLHRHVPPQPDAQH